MFHCAGVARQWSSYCILPTGKIQNAKGIGSVHQLEDAAKRDSCPTPIADFRVFFLRVFPKKARPETLMQAMMIFPIKSKLSGPVSPLSLLLLFDSFAVLFLLPNKEGLVEYKKRSLVYNCSSLTVPGVI